ncbi:hypothetical protein [Lysobacter niastensis]|uniref:Cytochrome c n=1 Tax=Lysobacter niastensis TaxID=380629 RepID=A0ABS0B6Q6_9GAMM|nr:hypothetical protein [Lysobacter niastensis]MBF6024701.1 hypothetical protein [Lysobacter niastensis]
MSDPQAGTAVRKSHATRYLFLFLIGLVIGVIATVMAMRAIDARRDHFPDSVMQVQQWHLGQLKDRVSENRCAATDTLPHLKALRTMTDNLEPAFADLKDDPRFRDHASKIRGTLDAALANPPLNCEGVGNTVKSIGEGCKACHQDFRG